MADQLKLVTLSPGGRPIVALDLEDGFYHRKARDTLKFTPPAKQGRAAGSTRRYAGSRPAGETHGNAALSWTDYAKGTSVEEVRASVEDLLARIDSAAPDGFVLHQLENAATPALHERRGPAAWTPTFKYVQVQGAKSMEVEVAIPVAPLPFGLPMDIDDEFDVNSIADYTFDQGGGTVTVAGGGLVPSSVALKRFYHSARGYTYGDVESGIEYAIGATSATLEVGPSIRRLDASNYLFLLFSGGTLQIWKRDGNVNSSLASTAQAIPTNTTFWLVLRGEGNTIIAEYWTAAPTPAGTPAKTLSHPLVGGDIAKFGTGVVGQAGPAGYWVPAQTADRINDYWAEPYVYTDRVTPAVFNLGGPIPGSAPAKVDVEIAHVGAAAPVWAQVAWTPRPAGGGQSPAPFGIVEAETGELDLVGFAQVGDGAARGANRLSMSASGVSSTPRPGASWPFEPALLPPDDFGDGEIMVEWWGRVLLPSTLVTPRIITTLLPFDATGNSQPSNEFGTLGKLLTVPTGSAWKPVKLGTFPMRALAGRSTRVKARLEFSWAAGSSGTVGIDYTWMVHPGRRIMLPTGKVNDASYPAFAPYTAETSRLIRSGGDGYISRPPGGYYPHGGAGGSEILFDPGNIDALVKMSDLVPDDPTASSASETLSRVATVHFAVWPRYRLLGQV